MPNLKTITELNTYLGAIEDRLDEVTADTAAFLAKAKDLTILKNSKYFGKPDKPYAETDGKLGEFAKAMVAVKRGSPTDKQRDLLMERKGSIEMETKADLGTPLTNDSATGSYLIPVEYYDEIIRVAADTSELVPLVRRIPMKSNTKYYPTGGTATAFTYVSSDGGALTEQNPTFNQTLLTAYTYAMWVGCTEALLEDDIVGLGEYLRILAGEAYAAKFDAEFLTGSGSPTTGVLNDGSVNTAQAGTGNTSYEDFEITDLYSLVEQLTTNAKRRGARFMMHPLLWDVVRKLKNADGDNIIAPWAETAAKSLFGYPVTFSDQMPSTDASNTAFVAFGNPRYLLFGDRVGMEMKFYDGTEYAVQYTEVFFRFRFRAAFDVGVPGAFSILKTASE